MARFRKNRDTVDTKNHKCYYHFQLGWCKYTELQCKYSHDDSNDNLLDVLGPKTINGKSYAGRNLRKIRRVTRATPAAPAGPAYRAPIQYPQPRLPRPTAVHPAHNQRSWRNVQPAALTSAQDAPVQPMRQGPAAVAGPGGSWRDTRSVAVPIAQDSLITYGRPQAWRTTQPVATPVAQHAPVPPTRRNPAPLTPPDLPPIMAFTGMEDLFALRGRAPVTPPGLSRETSISPEGIALFSGPTLPSSRTTPVDPWHDIVRARFAPLAQHAPVPPTRRNPAPITPPGLPIRASANRGGLVALPGSHWTPANVARTPPNTPRVRTSQAPKIQELAARLKATQLLACQSIWSNGRLTRFLQYLQQYTNHVDEIMWLDDHFGPNWHIDFQLDHCIEELTLNQYKKLRVPGQYHTRFEICTAAGQ